MTEFVYKIRRKSDGLFLGSREWGVTHSNVGKSYTSAKKAVAALKASLNNGYKTTKRQLAVIAYDHEVVEYKIAIHQRFHVPPESITTEHNP